MPATEGQWQVLVDKALQVTILRHTRQLEQAAVREHPGSPSRRAAFRADTAWLAERRYDLRSELEISYPLRVHRRAWR